MKRLAMLGAIVALHIGVAQSQTDVDDYIYVGYGTPFLGTTKSVTKVTSISEFKSAVSGSEPRTVIVEGEISNGGVIVLGSNKYITGGNFQETSYHIEDVSNITIRNVSMHIPAPKKKDQLVDHDGDLIHIEGSASNIWIDHCDLSAEYDGVDKDKYDGIIDTKKGCSKITVSWNFIHDAHKTNLNGYSDKDARNWKFSMHHNIFNNLGSRAPSLRGGEAVVFNNYYVLVHKTGVNSRCGAEIYCEKNYFWAVGSGKIEDPLDLGEGPIGAYYSDEPGKWNAVDNYYLECLGNQPTNNESTTSYKPSFMNGNKTIVPVMEVPDIIMEKAGVKGKEKVLKYPPTKIIQPAHHGVKTQKGTPSAIYTIRGMKISNGKATTRILSNGVYIVKVNGKWITRLHKAR